MYNNAMNCPGSTDKSVCADKLATNIWAYISSNGFDGVDIDWERSIASVTDTDIFKTIVNAIGSKKQDKLFTITPNTMLEMDYVGINTYVNWLNL